MLHAPDIRKKKNRWAEAAFGDSDDDTDLGPSNARPHNASLSEDSQAGGLAAAGTSLDWPY